MPVGERLDLGGDPEFYAVTKTGRAISAHNHQEIFGQRGLGGQIIRDGAAFEINPTASGCRDTFIPNAAHILKRLALALPRYELSCAPVVELFKRELINAPEDVLRGGCDPDYDAYTLSRKAPDEYRDNHRFTAGHIHLGLAHSYMEKSLLPKKTIEAPPEELVMNAAEVARMLDIVLGIPVVAMLGKTYAEGEAWRRQFYGQAGSFRLQPHGIEYRVPSARLWLSPIMLHAFLGLTQIFKRDYGLNVQGNMKAMAGMASGFTRLLDEETVRHIINSHDASTAQAFWFDVLRPHLVKLGGVPVELQNIRPSLYATIAPSFVTIDAIIRADMDGVHFVNSLRNNWGLYSNFSIVDHAYLGNQAANWGLFSELFFPQIGHVDGFARVPVMVQHPTEVATQVVGLRAGLMGDLNRFQLRRKV